MISSLAREANLWEAIKLRNHWSEAVRQLIALSNGQPYKLPGAKFAATVDQAIFALSYEQLAESERSKVASFFAPVYNFVRGSLIFRLVLPLVVLACALVTINDPTTIPSLAKDLFGRKFDTIETYAGAHKATIQMVTALYLALFPAIPKTGLAMLRKKISK